MATSTRTRPGSENSAGRYSRSGLSPGTDRYSADCHARRQRLNVSGAFVERLIAELRTRFTFVVLDVGPEPPSESQVTAAALRAADQVLVVATPDPPGLHRARVAVHDAAAILDRSRAALVLNRYDSRVHTDLRKVDAEIGLPIVSLVPEDTRTVQRALLAGQPAVCEPSSRIRRAIARPD